MKFGFDIDDTLINLRQHAFKLYNKKLNQDLSLDTFHTIPTVEKVVLKMYAVWERSPLIAFVKTYGKIVKKGGF